MYRPGFKAMYVDLHHCNNQRNYSPIGSNILLPFILPYSFLLSMLTRSFIHFQASIRHRFSRNVSFSVSSFSLAFPSHSLTESVHVEPFRLLDAFMPT